MVKPGQLEIYKKNLSSFCEDKPPANKKQIRSFNGFCKVYRRFIDDFTVLSHPFNRLLKKGAPDAFELDAEQHDMFNASINNVCSPPVLVLAKVRDCDSSDYGIGCA